MRHLLSGTVLLLGAAARGAGPGVIQEPAATAPAQDPVPAHRAAEQAVAAYGAGQYAAALAGMQAACAAVAAPPAEWRLALALAALQLQRTADAEAALRPLLEATGQAWWAEVQFVQGQAALQRAERALAAAQLQDAEPFALPGARRGAAEALAAFCAADRARGGWPAALRNAERAARFAAEIERFAATQRPAPNRQEPDAPPPEAEAARERTAEEAAPELAQDALSAAAAAALLERVQQREREKWRVRREQQRRSARAGERDW